MNESLNELTENVKRDEYTAMKEEQTAMMKEALQMQLFQIMEEAKKVGKSQHQSEWYKQTIAMVPVAMMRWGRMNLKTLRFQSGKLKGNACPDMKIRNRDGAWENVYYCFCECGATLEVFESDLIHEKVTECEVCADPDSFTD